MVGFQAGGGQHDGVVLALVELAQAGVEVAAQGLDQQVGAHRSGAADMRTLGLCDTIFKEAEQLLLVDDAGGAEFDLEALGIGRDVGGVKISETLGVAQEARGVEAHGGKAHALEFGEIDTERLRGSEDESFLACYRRVGMAPFKTVADYDNNLKRLAGFDKFLDESIVRFRQGMKSGVVQPKLVVENVIGQLDGLIAQGVTGSVFYKPVTKFPEGFSETDKVRLKNDYAAAVQTGVLPAYTRLRDFLKSEYLPVSRASVGISQMPGGPALYQYLIQSQTTTDMTPEAVHALGLSEVARITGEMQKVKATVGFKGTLPEFFVAVREDPKQHPTSGQAFGDSFRAIGKQVDTKIPTLFSTIPKTPLEIRPAPAYAEKNQAAGYYNPGTPDGSRPGIFYYNTYDIKSRAGYGTETLYLHEGIPGHHFQISLAQENTDLPPFQRFGGNTAFVEGWALYAESLGHKLGMYTDPYQLYGHLDDEMLRAMRLVVDSGLHAKGWTRDQAIAYMMANSAMSRTDATAEVERYIAIPGQALAYKIGQIQISKLRARAETALGPKFDIRDFHAQVLDTGALPMAVLESKIDAWIARGGGK